MPGKPGKPADESKLTRALNIAERVEPWLGWLWPIAAGVLGISTGGVAGLGVLGVRALLRLRRRARTADASPRQPIPTGVPEFEGPPQADRRIVQDPAERVRSEAVTIQRESLWGEALRRGINTYAKEHDRPDAITEIMSYADQIYGGLAPLKRGSA